MARDIHNDTGGIMRVFAIAIGAVAAVAGCSSLLTQYEAPSSGTPSAVLTVHNASPGEATLWPNSDAAHCKGLLSLASTFNMKPDARAEILVKAGEDLSFVSVQDWAGRTCTVDATFRPESGRRYVADLIGDGRRCALVISREESRGDRVVITPEPSFRPRKRVEPLVSTAYCE
jgi:hypothetical protein